MQNPNRYPDLNVTPAGTNRLSNDTAATLDTVLDSVAPLKKRFTQYPNSEAGIKADGKEVVFIPIS